MGMSRYYYLNGSRHQCVDTVKCMADHAHVYRAEWACLKIPADTSNNGFFGCFNNENFYYCIRDHVLRFGKDAKCVHKSECRRFR